MDAIAAVLRRHWGLADFTLSPLDGGMNSYTWLVETGTASFVAKRVSPGSLPALLGGCEVAARLADAGLVTGRPVPTCDDELVATDPAVALLEYVPGRELEGEDDDEQGWMAQTLARLHVECRPTGAATAAGFYDWLTPDAPGVASYPWLPTAIRTVRQETDRLAVSWSLLHTDPTPEAFRRDDARGVTGLIDWTGAQPGPVLYDVASAVMYLGGPVHAATFLDTYRRHGPVTADELGELDTFRRFRWAVQAAYFAGRLATGDLTGVTDRSDNERGLAHARAGLAGLGVDVG
jgi:homoserine kinase type II